MSTCTIFALGQNSAALPIAALLVATAAVASFGPSTLAGLLWWVGSLSQVYVTVWVLARWWRGNQAGGLQWAGVTPALFIPIVGNVLAPLAGAPLGHAEWAAAQFGIGLMFWPLAMALIVSRVAIAGLWARWFPALRDMREFPVPASR